MYVVTQHFLAQFYVDPHIISLNYCQDVSIDGRELKLLKCGASSGMMFITNFHENPSGKNTQYCCKSSVVLLPQLG